ncbi:MAG TPA: branched-chain amino acid ABC transporter permease, partial [bacterium]|nr:branched-chain amino acid ABC transporter permease [bacterium]
AIATLGVGEIIRVLITNLKITGGAQGLSGVPSPQTLTGVRAWRDYYAAAGAQTPDWVFWLPLIYMAGFVIVTVAVIWNLIHSATGRAIVSVREDEVAAEAMGVNTTRYKVLAFVIGSFFAGLAGAWQVSRAGVAAAEEFNIFRTIELLIFIVFGGLGSITGSIVAAAGLTFLTEELKDLSRVPAVAGAFGSLAGWWDQIRLWAYGTFGVLNPRNLPPTEATGLPVTPYQFSLGPLWRALFSLLLILIMLLRPAGLFGRWELPYLFRKRRERALQLALAGVGPVPTNLEEPTARGPQDPAITPGLHPVGEESTDVTRRHETGEGRA